MFVASRRASALHLLVSLFVISCARGSQGVAGSPLGLVSPAEPPVGAAPGDVAPPAGDALGDGSPSAGSGADAHAAPTGPLVSSPSATAAPAESSDAAGVYVLTEDDADIAANDASNGLGDDADDAPALVGPGVPLPTPGEIAITEVMLSPSGPEPDSEWFEIDNLASSPRLLSGLTIQDGYGDIHVIASSPPVVVAPGAYGLLVRDQTAATQALVPASAILYAYGAGLRWDEGIELDGGTAGDLSLWRDGTLLVDVPYGMWDATWVGQSIELVTPQSDESDPTQWCVAQALWATGSDDGTPGAANDCGP